MKKKSSSEIDFLKKPTGENEKTILKQMEVGAPGPLPPNLQGGKVGGKPGEGVRQRIEHLSSFDGTSNVSRAKGLNVQRLAGNYNFEQTCD